MLKITKLLFIPALALFFAFSLNACKKCKDEDPRARIINNGTSKASVQIKTSGGNTVNINNVAPGTSSTYSSYAEGTVTFTINVNNNDYVKTLSMSNCFDYDVAIDANNTITAIPLDRN